MVIPVECVDCLRLNKDKLQCKAFKECMKNCKSKITNKLDYLRQLKQMIDINSKGNNTKYFRELQNEYKELYKVYERELVKDIYEVYREDLHRGTGGGSSEGGGNRNLKQIMKDNRILECKPRKNDNKEYLEAVKKWEEEQGVELDKYKSIGYGMSHNKFDEYVGRVTDENGILPTDKEIEESMEKLLIEHCLTEEDVIKGLQNVKCIKNDPRS